MIWYMWVCIVHFNVISICHISAWGAFLQPIGVRSSFFFTWPIYMDALLKARRIRSCIELCMIMGENDKDPENERCRSAKRPSYNSKQWQVPIDKPCFTGAFFSTKHGPCATQSSCRTWAEFHLVWVPWFTWFAITVIEISSSISQNHT